MADFIQHDAKTLLDEGKVNLYKKRQPTIKRAPKKVEYVDKNAEDEEEPDFEHSMSNQFNMNLQNTAVRQGDEPDFHPSMTGSTNQNTMGSAMSATVQY